MHTRSSSRRNQGTSRSSHEKSDSSKNMEGLNLKPDPDQTDKNLPAVANPVEISIKIEPYEEIEEISIKCEPFDPEDEEYMQNETAPQKEESSAAGEVPQPTEETNLKTESPALTAKRKHDNLTLVQKMEILRKVDKGMPYTDIATEYNVGRATVYDIRKNRHKIETYVKKATFGLEKRQRIRSAGIGKHPKLEEALFSWFLEERRRQTPITSLVLRKKALDIYHKLYNKTDFRASERWLAKFRTRFGIHLPSCSNRSLELLCEPVVIVDETLNQSNKPENSYSENSCENGIMYNTDCPVRSEDALDSVEICIKWAEENALSSDMVKNLQEIREQVVTKINNSN